MGTIEIKPYGMRVAITPEVLIALNDCSAPWASQAVEDALDYFDKILLEETEKQMRNKLNIAHLELTTKQMIDELNKLIDEIDWYMEILVGNTTLHWANKATQIDEQDATIKIRCRVHDAKDFIFALMLAGEPESAFVFADNIRKILSLDELHKELSTQPGIDIY